MTNQATQPSADHAVYVEHGYKDRSDYLRNLADDHGVELSTVLAMAELFGPEEDFDGLVTSVEDAARWAGDEL